MRSYPCHSGIVPRNPATDMIPRTKYVGPLDEGIKPFVEILVAGGIETYESCQGGKGHSFCEPTIRFFGERAEGFRALAIALQHALPVSALRRVWSIEDGEPVGPTWEIVFSCMAHARVLHAHGIEAVVESYID